MQNSTDYFSTHYKDYVQEVQVYYSSQIKRYSNNFDHVIAKYNDTSTCLDLGCGIGDFVAYLHSKKLKHVTAIDTSAESIDICNKNFSGYEFKVESIETFFEKDTRQFDIISMFSVLEHLPVAQIVSILNLIKQHLKPGGVFVFSTPNMDTLFGNTNGRYNDFTHTIGFTESSLTQALRLAEFSTIHIYGSLPDKNPSFKAIILRKVYQPIAYGILKAFLKSLDLALPTVHGYVLNGYASK